MCVCFFFGGGGGGGSGGGVQIALVKYLMYEFCWAVLNFLLLL